MHSASELWHSVAQVSDKMEWTVSRTMLLHLQRTFNHSVKINIEYINNQSFRKYFAKKWHTMCTSSSLWQKVINSQKRSGFFSPPSNINNKRKVRDKVKHRQILNRFAVHSNSKAKCKLKRYVRISHGHQPIAEILPMDLFRRLIPSTAERLVFSNGRFGWRRAGKLDVCPIEPHKWVTAACRSEQFLS